MTAFPPSATRVAIYARSSTAMQSVESIEDQLGRCHDYAARHRWVVAEAYFDAGRSGAALVGPEGLFRMMAAADHGEFDLVLVEDLDRLSRSASDTRAIVEDLGDMDVGVCTVASGMVSNLEVAFKAVRGRAHAIDLNQAAAVQRLFLDHVAGFSALDIARALNAAAR